MIQMIYDPLFGVRYIDDGVDPRIETTINPTRQNTLEQYNRTSQIRARQIFRAINTKSK